MIKDIPKFYINHEKFVTQQTLQITNTTRRRQNDTDSKQ